MIWIETFITACWVRLYHLWQFINNFFLYYLWHPTFFLADMLILFQYFFRSPFKIIRLYDEAHSNHQIGPYGETDFRALSRLLDTFSIPITASIADLGSGRGRTSFFLRLVRGQKKVLGIEYHKLFVTRAERVRRWLGITDLSLMHGDWATVPLHDIDVVYIYGILTDEKASKKLAHHLALLKPGTQIITVSSWFGETLPDSYQLENQTTISFEWGTTEAFLQTVTKKGV